MIFQVWANKNRIENVKKYKLNILWFSIHETNIVKNALFSKKSIKYKIFNLYGKKLFTVIQIYLLNSYRYDKTYHIVIIWN